MKFKNRIDKKDRTEQNIKNLKESKKVSNCKKATPFK